MIVWIILNWEALKAELTVENIRNRIVSAYKFFINFLLGSPNWVFFGLVFFSSEIVFLINIIWNGFLNSFNSSNDVLFTIVFILYPIYPLFFIIFLCVTLILLFFRSFILSWFYTYGVPHSLNNSDIHVGVLGHRITIQRPSKFLSFWSWFCSFLNLVAKSGFPFVIRRFFYISYLVLLSLFILLFRLVFLAIPAWCILYVLDKLEEFVDFLILVRNGEELNRTSNVVIAIFSFLSRVWAFLISNLRRLWKFCLFCINLLRTHVPRIPHYVVSIFIPNFINFIYSCLFYVFFYGICNFLYYLLYFLRLIPWLLLYIIEATVVYVFRLVFYYVVLVIFYIYIILYKIFFVPLFVLYLFLFRTTHFASICAIICFDIEVVISRDYFDPDLFDPEYIPGLLLMGFLFVLHTFFDVDVYNLIYWYAYIDIPNIEFPNELPKLNF